MVLSVLLWLGPFFYYLPKVSSRGGGGSSGLPGTELCPRMWPGWGWGSQPTLSAPKAVLACINIASMRQMFFQMQELPQLWHISRVDFVRSCMTLGAPQPKFDSCALNFHNHSLPTPWSLLIPFYSDMCKGWGPEPLPP